jgi:hypothetical protein
MYAGMGYRPLLLVQLLLFSAAAALLSVQLLLLAVTIDNLTVLRWVARYLIMAGAVCAGANLTGMLVALTWRQSRPTQT